jgi:predicted acylesterase/phospholipase RssA
MNQEESRAGIDAKRQAVILSGGGANGAYEVGVLKALLMGQSGATRYTPLEPDIFTGTSVGAFNAAFLVSCWQRYGHASVANLENVWLNQLSSESRTVTNNGYRFVANPAEFFDPRNWLSNPVGLLSRFVGDSLYLFWDGLNRLRYVVNPEEDEEPLTTRFLHTLAIDNFINREPFNQLVREVVNFESIRSSSKILNIATTNWETGDVVEFTNYDFTDKLGPRIIMASSAIPGFFTPHQVGAQPYVDGSVLMNMPLNPAIKAGGDVLHVVYLDPDVSSIPIHYLSNVLSTLYRTQVINWAHTVNESIRVAKGINDALILIRSALRGADGPEVNVKGIFRALVTFGGSLEDLSGYRMLTIHRYHPRDELGGPLSLLDLRRERIEYLIDRGFRDAVSHNCTTSKCVLPPKQDVDDPVQNP